MTAFIAHVTLDHLAPDHDGDSDSDPAASPALRAAADTRTKGYDAVCMPLTTDRWRMRWRDMCLLSSTPDVDFNPTVETASETEAGSADTGKTGLERRAELWRANPVFAKDEVTVTRLGARFCPVLVCRIV